MNYQLVHPSDFSIIDFKTVNSSIDLEGSQNYLFDLPKEFGGTLEGAVKAKDSLMTFDIKIGAEEAQKAFEEKEA